MITDAQYTTPTRPPLCMPYTIQDWQWQWQYRVKGQQPTTTTTTTPTPGPAALDHDHDHDHMCVIHGGRAPSTGLGRLSRRPNGLTRAPEHP